jgi:pimeloyl-ACP methyl ester carboxylesterase
MAYVPRREPRFESLTVRGLRHRLTWWGERTGTPIVLLHGFMDCGATWQFLVDCLPRDWSLAAPDWRGSATAGVRPGPRGTGALGREVSFRLLCQGRVA